MPRWSRTSHEFGLPLSGRWRRYGATLLGILAFGYLISRPVEYARGETIVRFNLGRWRTGSLIACGPNCSSEEAGYGPVTIERQSCHYEGEPRFSITW